MAIKKAKINDYLIHRDGKRNHLVQAIGDSRDDRVFVLFDKTRLSDEPKQEMVLLDSISLNLGPSPSAGSVYGCKIEPWHNTVNSEAWGTIHFFKELEKKEKEGLKEALNLVHRDLKKKASIAFLPLANIQVRPQQGKFAGWYHYNSVKGDHIVLRPHSYDVNYLRDLLFHECGHGIETRMIPRTVWAKWIKLYTRVVKLGQFDHALLETMWTHIKDAPSVADAYTELGEDEEAAMNACIDYVCSTFSLTTKQIDCLLEANLFSENYWPTHDLDNHAYDEPLGEYANKNPSECFAECFRLSMMGFTLPKSFDKIMSNTLAIVRGMKTV